VGETRALVELWQSWNSADPRERLGHDFVSYVADGYQGNGIVHAVVNARAFLFAQATFQFQALGDVVGRMQKGQLFGTPALELLEVPWPSGSTVELLIRMEQDVSLAGNAFVHRGSSKTLQRLRPDWVDIISDGRTPIAYLYTPGGRGAGGGTLLDESEVAHWSPVPDPLKAFRGMSWLTPVVREIVSDGLMTRHKQKFFENAATPNLLVKSPKKLTDAQRNQLARTMRSRHEGVDNAYKTLLLEEGADATVIGSDMRAVAFDAIQAAGENRIAAAAGVPGIVANLKEGLQSATYSNYQQAMRRMAEVTTEPMWQSVCPVLAKLLTVPPSSRLWYDKSDIPALRQDAKEEAEIAQRKALTVEAYIRGGFLPDSIVDALVSGDLTRLEHSGLFSVQLQPPTTPEDLAEAAAAQAAAPAEVEPPTERPQLTAGTNGREPVPT
jgi:phage portal protein BeeE